MSERIQETAEETGFKIETDLQENPEGQEAGSGQEDVHIQGQSPRAAQQAQAIRNRSAAIFMNGCSDCALSGHADAKHNNLDGFGSIKPKIALVFNNVHNYNSNGTNNGQTVEVTDINRKISHVLERIKNLGIPRSEVRVISALRCFTRYSAININLPSSLLKTPDIDIKKCVRSCKNKVLDELNEYDPDFVILFGPEAFLSILGKTDTEEKKIPGSVFNRDGRVYMCTYHPSGDNFGLINNHINKLPYLLDGGIDKDKDLKYKTIKTHKELDYIVNFLQKQKGFTFDFEVDTKLDRDVSGFDSTDKLLCIGLSWAPNKAVCIPLDHDDSPFKDDPYVKEKVKELLLSDTPKCGHNALYDCYAAYNFFGGLKVKNVVFDTMLAHHLLDPTRGTHSLKALACRYTKFGGYEDGILEDLQKFGLEERSYGKIELNKLIKYCCLDVDVTYQLWITFAKELNKNADLMKVFNNITMPCHDLMFDLRTKGWFVNENKLEELRDYYTTKVKEIDAWLKDKLEMPDLNISSTAQLRAVFKKLNISSTKMTKGGQQSTDEDSIKKAVVSDISEDTREILNKILDYRRYSKALSTYIDGFKRHVRNGTIQTEYLIIGTETARLSSLRPNMQNISSDLEGIPPSKKIKSMFVAPENYEMACADYSQIEVRNLGNISGEDVIIDTFLTDRNIHISTASVVFGDPYDDIEKDGHIYRAGKTVNFAVIYGAGYKRVAQSIKESALMTKQEIIAIIKKMAISENINFRLSKTFLSFNKRFANGTLQLDELYEALAMIVIDNINREWPAVREWKKSTYEFAEKNEKVVTPFGRVRYLKKNSLSKANFFNQAINCLSDDTEILTKDGWKFVDQLSKDDLVYSVNEKTKKLELVGLVAISEANVVDHKMWNIEHNAISAIATPDHRWLVDFNGKPKTKTSEQLTMHGHDKIWIASDGVDTASSIWDDDEIELMGWVLTDGCYKNQKYKSGNFLNPNAVLVTQCKQKYLDEINKLFNRLGKHSYYKSKRNQYFWGITCKGSKRIRDMMPNKTLTPDVLNSMSVNQLKLLFNTMLKGDGSWDSHANRFRKFTAGTKERADVFLMLCAMVGQPARSKERDYTKYKPKKYQTMTNIPKSGKCWEVELVVNKRAQPQYKSKWIKWSGRVWCPTLDGPNDAWVAKRNNKVFITKNTPIQSVSSDCLLLAMIELNKFLKSYKSYIIGTVHDSVIFYIHKDEKHILKDKIRIIMEEEPLKFKPEFFRIPMKVGMQIGNNWSEMSDWE